ncbi:hypothetical protein D6201_00470 [Aurantiacibacter aquimixticola]|uniref:Uncharacterized protein n=2 Tax=Aurantiacibacter aquimixticola TaxID=1958945 RepID=A0A419RQH9_9SPHN|nr:hypothetical protein D6201_00470 [Aurantiacibacter aquimixticola]
MRGGGNSGSRGTISFMVRLLETVHPSDTSSEVKLFQDGKSFFQSIASAAIRLLLKQRSESRLAHSCNLKLS